MKTNKWFLRNFWENSSRKLFPTQLNSTAKTFRTAVFQESLALNFKFRDNTRFLTGWHLFRFFTAAPFLCTRSVILDFCFILVASNTIIWASLVGAHRSKLEVEYFIFHVIVFSRETFQTLTQKFFPCVPQKVFGVYTFPVLV